jgi:hypothetical protein
METAKEFLRKKGLKKVHQPSKRYNLSVRELSELLDEYSIRVLKDFLNITDTENIIPLFYSTPEK